jgi:transcriptional regulator
MYVPSAFRMDDLPDLHGVLRATPLATLVTTTEAGLLATPLPLLLSPDEGPFGTLHGHLARANPQWQHEARGEALAVFAGPDAYVTPAWYASKQEHGRVVPTWNYVAVHAYGTPEFYDDPDRLLEAVTRLTAEHEAPRPEPWAVADAPERFIQGQLRGIVGLRLPILRIEGKRKMSQNRMAAGLIPVEDGKGA